MKRLCFLIAILTLSAGAFAQNIYIRGDTINVTKDTRPAELKILNSTKDTTGVLTNIGGGRTRFKKPRALTDTTFVVGNDTVKLTGPTTIFKDSLGVFLRYAPGSPDTVIIAGNETVFKDSVGIGLRYAPAAVDGEPDTVVIYATNPGGGVTSFNTRTGAVVPASGDYTTDQVTETSNLYFTNARTRAALSGLGQLGYNSGTGQFSLNFGGLVHPVVPKFDASGNIVASNFQDFGTFATYYAFNPGAELLYLRNTSSTGLSAIEFRQDDDTYGLRVGYDNSTNRAYYQSATVHDFRIAGATKFFIDASGNLIASNLATGGADEMVTVNASGQFGRQAITAGGVTSFNSRTGAVVPVSGDYTTAQVTESGNLYFTNARARGAISSLHSALTYNSATGEFDINISNLRSSLATGTPNGTRYLRDDWTWQDLPSGTPGVTSFNSRTGAVIPVSGDYNTDLVTEGSTNLYFTNARARGALSSNHNGLTYNNSTGVFDFNIANLRAALATGTPDGTKVLGDNWQWKSIPDQYSIGAACFTLESNKTWSAASTPEVIPLDTEHQKYGITHVTTPGANDEITFNTFGIYDFNVYINYGTLGTSGAVKIGLQKWDGDSWENVSGTGTLIRIPDGGGTIGSATMNFQLQLNATEKVRFVGSVTNATDDRLVAITATDGIANVPAFRVTITGHKIPPP